MGTLSRQTPTPTQARYDHNTATTTTTTTSTTYHISHSSPTKATQARKPAAQAAPPASSRIKPTSVPTQNRQQKELYLDPASKARPSTYTRTSFLDDPPSDYSEDDVAHNQGVDAAASSEDPHDLTWSEHFPRASMVENMAMALDQLSSAPSTNEYPPTSYRPRGHTLSSSVSSEGDIRGLTMNSTTNGPRGGGRPNNVRYTTDPSKLPSIFGDDEDSARAKVYDSQRAGPPRVKTRTHRPGHSGSKEAASISSVDLSHLKQFAGKLGPAGNRRSRSFDFGSTRPSALDNNNAPGPGVFAAHDVSSSPVSSTFPSQVPARRNSTKSTRNQVRAKSSLGTEPTMARDASSTAPMTPIKAATTDRFQGNLAKPGLFKRFFGSSRTNSTPPSSFPRVTTMERSSQDQLTATRDYTQPSATPTVNRLRKDEPKASMDISKENIPPLHTKKSTSSFFRRRKKSVSGVPPPMPLTLGTNVTSGDAGEKSPVGSLKTIMDPYLATVQKDPASPVSPLGTFFTPTDSAGTGVSKDEKPLPNPEQRSSSKLSVPQKETFLADSSSAEDLRGGRREEQRKRPTASNRSDSRQSQTSASQVGVSVPPSSTIRPVVEKRTSSWQSQSKPENLNVPIRKQSLPAPDSSQVNQATLQMLHKNLSGSDVSDYKSAPSTPHISADMGPALDRKSPKFHVSHPSVSMGPTTVEAQQALRVYNNGEEDIDGTSAAAWLGEAGSERERVRAAYMEYFDFTNHNILSALRTLCSKLALKAESQLIDRIIVAFSQRWCECNPNHGFRHPDVVHTICYSIFLLNTDLHMADIGSKMTRSQFVKNSMSTLRGVAAEASESKPANPQMLTVRSNSYGAIGVERVSTDRDIRASSALGHRPNERLVRTDSGDVDLATNTSGPLVEAPYNGPDAGWYMHIETVLKDFYQSIQRDPLPLFGVEANQRNLAPSNNNNLLSLGGLRRTPSVLSKQSDTRSRYGPDSKSLGSRWNPKTRSRPRLGSIHGFGSSKTSLEDGSSAWSPSMSSTWSKVSLGKTLTNMSVDSFGNMSVKQGDYQSSIGFANALSQAIIREDQIDVQSDDGMKAAPLLEDESLELEGAPWAKEGIVQHKCHLETTEKRSKDRNWNDCFAVIEKGWMRLFSFSMTAKSLRTKARNQKSGGVVGGGNWQDNAEEVWKFMLRHTIANSLPSPGYSKARPHVWALSLPTGAVHLFSVGTPDIVKEFVSTANFWSARLSKEPMIGGISSMEYGWSDNVINRALVSMPPSANDNIRTSTSTADMPRRPSTQLSVRSSIDHGSVMSASVRAKLPGDRIRISDWTPPQQSLLPSQLMEVDQLRALLTYVSAVEQDLQHHNELRPAMLLAFSQKHPNYSRAMTNWEKKSSYLLREIVKFKNYIDALQSAQISKDKVYRLRQQEEDLKMANEDSLAIYNTTSLDYDRP